MVNDFKDSLKGTNKVFGESLEKAKWIERKKAISDWMHAQMSGTSIPRLGATLMAGAVLISAAHWSDGIADRMAKRGGEKLAKSYVEASVLKEKGIEAYRDLYRPSAREGKGQVTKDGVKDSDAYKKAIEELQDVQQSREHLIERTYQTGLGAAYYIVEPGRIGKLLGKKTSVMQVKYVGSVSIGSFRSALSQGQRAELDDLIAKVLNCEDSKNEILKRAGNTGVKLYIEGMSIYDLHELLSDGEHKSCLIGLIREAKPARMRWEAIDDKVFGIIMCGLLGIMGGFLGLMVSVMGGKGSRLRCIVGTTAGVCTASGLLYLGTGEPIIPLVGGALALAAFGIGVLTLLRD